MLMNVPVEHTTVITRVQTLMVHSLVAATLDILCLLMDTPV